MLLVEPRPYKRPRDAGLFTTGKNLMRHIKDKLSTALFFSLILLATLSFSLPAKATTGGPKPIEVLGLDRADKKVFWLVHDYSESGELPRLHFFHLDSPQRAVEVRSWYEDELNYDYGAFETRLANLRRHLVPLEELSPKGLHFCQLVVDTDEYLVTDDLPPVSRFSLDIELSSPLLIQPLKTRLTTFRSPADAALQALYVVPDTEIIIAQISYTGIPIETGYRTDSLLIGKRKYWKY